MSVIDADADRKDSSPHARGDRPDRSRRVVPLSESDRIEIILSLNKHDVFESELLSC